MVVVVVIQFYISDVNPSTEVLVQALSPVLLYCNVSNLDSGSSATIWWKRNSDGQEFKVIPNHASISTIRF